jgi:hypothetical protein
MRTLYQLASAAVVSSMLLVCPASAAEPDKPGLARALADRLTARRLFPRTHSTDFAGTELGCITLPRYELRPYGYPGHAFVCEDAQTGEVLGAVLNRRGIRLCTISGFYTDNACYDLEICGYREQLCVVG